MAINIGYFGLSLNTSNLSGNPFMNCFLSAAAEVPAYIVSIWLLKKCPRRPLLSAFLVIGGGVLLLIQFIPDCESCSGAAAGSKPSNWSTFTDYCSFCQRSFC